MCYIEVQVHKLGLLLLVLLLQILRRQNLLLSGPLFNISASSWCWGHKKGAAWPEHIERFVCTIYFSLSVMLPSVYQSLKAGRHCLRWCFSSDISWTGTMREEAGKRGKERMVCICENSQRNIGDFCYKAMNLCWDFFPPTDTIFPQFTSLMINYG